MGDNDKGPEEKITSFCFLTRVFNLFCCILFSLFFIRFQPVISYLFRFIKQLYLNFKGAYQIVESIYFCKKSYLFFVTADLSSARVKWMVNRSCPYTTTCPMRTT